MGRCQRSSHHHTPDRTTGLILLALMMLAATAASAFGAESGETHSWLEPDRIVKAQRALDDLRSDHPQLRAYRNGDVIGRIYGTAFGGGVSPLEAADQFRTAHSDVFGVDPGDLLLGKPGDPDITTQPVMYDRETDSYKFTLVYYTQTKDGFPVYGAELRLLVRNEPGYPLVLASSTLRDLGASFTANKSVGGANSATAVQAARASEPYLTMFTDQEPLIWAGRNDASEAPRTAVRFVGSSDEGEKFIFIVDPLTGDILYKENGLIDVDVIGDVQGNATQGNGSEQCEEELPEYLPYARVNIGGASDYTDANGEFEIFNLGTTDVVVESRMWGEWFRVYNYTGTDLVMYDTVTPPGPSAFLHNEANTNETVRAQVNAYYQANLERDYVLLFNPSYPSLMNNEFPIYTNRTDIYCPGNAWYDQIEISLNFCRSGSGYPNTAWSSVLHHEFGHHLIQMAGSGQDQYGEGMSDCMAIIMSDDPRLGLGFFGNCTQSLRHAVNDAQYPCSGEAHDCAELLSGAVWDARNALAANYPATYREILSNLVINSILLHTGSLITPQIAIDFLTLDDNDANLDNGTPHYFEICEGFSAHNMDCPELAPLWFEYPDGRPSFVLPDTSTSFRVIVHANAVQPVATSGEAYFSVDGAPYQAATVTEVATNEYEVDFPQVTCGNSISWYFSVGSDGLGQVTDPTNAPSDAFSVVVATAFSVAVDDNFETDLGWTVGGSVSDGAWNRGVPVGGGDRGDPANDYDGSGSCFLTDNVDGNSDVDGGITTLYSPAIDIRNASDARISYARWFSNSTGAAPNADVMSVYVSNDDGSSWTHVETVGPTDQASGGWYQHSFFVSEYTTPSALVKVRFDAADTGDGSVVEAAVDAFQVTAYECNSTALAIVTYELPDWTVGITYSQQINHINGSGEVTFEDIDDGLDGTGLTLSAAGLLSGTPTQVGPIVFTAQATDGIQTDQQALTLTINAAVDVQSASLQPWTAGQPYPPTQFSAVGGTGAKAWSDLNGDLAGSGLALSSTGQFSGIPNAEGAIDFTAQAMDIAGSYDQEAMSVTINPAVAITTESIPDSDVGDPFSVQVEATGGTGSLTWSDLNGDLSGTGLTLSSSGLLSGTVSSEMTVVFTARAADGTGSNDTREYTFAFDAGCCVGDMVGNIDGDINDDVSIGDLTVLIDFLFVTFTPPACLQEADVDMSGQPDPGIADISLGDLSALIDHLFVSFAALPPCP